MSDAIDKKAVIDKLRENRNLIEQEEIDGFDEAIDLLETIEPDLLFVRELVHIFYDEVDIADPMERLLEYFVDRVSRELAITVILQETATMYDEAKDWLRTLYIVIVIPEDTFEYARNIYASLPTEEKRVVELVLRSSYVDERDVDFAEELKELVNKIII